MWQLGLVYLVLIVLGVIGWVHNIVNIMNSPVEATGLFNVQVIGIFLAPLGALLGWLV